MKRRDFIAGLTGAAVVGPRGAWGQQSLPRVGILLIGGTASPKDLAVAAELSRIGYVEGRNIVVEVRAADGDLARLPALARELVAAKPTVLIGAASASATALIQATRDIPIVMSVVGDPIATGLSTRYPARPAT